MSHFTRFFQTLLLVCICKISFATVRTVSNNSNSPAQFTDLQIAINASAVGDTVYVQGSPASYGNVTIDRKITLIGAGYAVSGSQFNLGTTIGTITLDTITTFSPPPLLVSGTRILGCNFSQLIVSSTETVNSVIVERCALINSLIVSGTEWVIRNNFTTQINLVNRNNCLIANNLIAGQVLCTVGNTGIVITNNVFHPTSGSSINNLANGVISNNIFWFLNNPSFNNVSNCTMSHNLTLGAQSFVLPTAGNSGSGNLNNTDPVFVNVSTANNWTINDISGFNFGFQVGSPAINAGSDGTNIGVTGGPFAMNPFNGMPSIPQISELNINNAVLTQGQQLNINFKARKRN